MAADSNMIFHYGAVQDSAFNRHTLSFQSGAINSMAGGTSNSGSMIPAGNSAGALYLDPVPGLKHDTGLAVDWSIEEQSILEEGLVKFADEPCIMMYIKIAATLADKTVRDVALRCRWMNRKENGKRLKQERHCIGKKMKEKEKLVDSSSNANIQLAMQPNSAAYSPLMHHLNNNERISCEAVGGTPRLLLEQNFQFFSQIQANLSMLKVQDNIDLFYSAMNNIIAILNDMRELPGIMSSMPPLPVSINEELVNTILPSTAQAMTFGAPSAAFI